jgi:multidrug efflux pump subunit AcrA (membrane-fusion protein)
MGFKTDRISGVYIQSLALLVLWISLISCSEKTDKIQPVKRDLMESVYASVTVQPDSLYKVYASVSGILDKLWVVEGDLVDNEEPIAQIVNSTPLLNSQNTKFALDLAKENYKGRAAILYGLEDEIEAAKLSVINDSINFFRQKSLWAQKIGSHFDYETKKLNYELATNQLSRLINKYERTKNELKTAISQAEINHTTATIATNDFTVTSKLKGKIYALLKEPGEIINSSEPIASIGSANRFVMQLLVDEVDIVSIALNQEVLIDLEAYSNTIFEGEISKIYPKKDERNQTFTVEAVFKTSPEILYPGLSGEANIIISTKEDVLTIPKAYLIGNNQVKTKDGLVTIKSGLQNMDYVEVLSGIDKETFIYKPKQ